MKKPLKHEHLIIRAEVKNPPKDEKFLKNWVLKLIEKIGMKLLSGPISAYVDMPGNEGATCVAIIETSHIAIHIWDALDPALIQLDVYSCSDLNPEIVIKEIMEFEPVSIQYKFLDREFAIKEVEDL